jgi:hypothetical protein
LGNRVIKQPTSLNGRFSRVQVIILHETHIGIVQFFFVGHIASKATNRGDDTEGDGLPDDIEHDVYSTGPFLADTDGISQERS